MVDPKFAREIIALGGKTLKLCMQCANCGVICPLSPEENPYPRKEMIWAQWGLKDRLIRDPDIWLCYNCGDCSKYCPRNAKPGQILNAIRARVLSEFVWPKFLGRVLNRSWSFPIFVIVLPIIVIGGLIYGLGLTPPTTGEIVYSKYIPIEYVEAVGFLLGGWVILISLIGIWRFWLAITDGGGASLRVKPVEGGEVEVRKGSSFMGMYFLDSFFYALKDILWHNWFKVCELNRPRFIAHLLIFYGFIGLGLTAGIDVIGKYIFGLEHLPWPWEETSIFSMVKGLGLLSGLALIIGSIIAIWNRTFHNRVEGGSYYDWFFLLIVLLVGLSGYAATITRIFESVNAYYLYVVHLYFVFMLIVYAPYSKFAHLLYRSVAMVYAKTSGREPREVPTSFWERF